MKWENLQTNQCPHCEEPLQRGEAVADGFTCTKCTFHITIRRFESIVEHRRRGTTDTIPKMKWQYLLQDRCPIDQQELSTARRGSFVLHRCTGPGCVFRITDKLLEEILLDPEHPANRFKNQP